MALEGILVLFFVYASVARRSGSLLLVVRSAAELKNVTHGQIPFEDVVISNPSGFNAAN